MKKKQSCGSLCFSFLALSCLIGEALADDALQRFDIASRVIEAGRFPVAVAKIELSHVAVQMLLGAMLIDSRYLPRAQVSADPSNQARLAWCVSGEWRGDGLA